jgi:transcriptional regulator with XRE-family HTH domain
VKGLPRIRDLRKASGYSQSDLAKMVSTTQQTIARWEKGSATPPLSALRDLALIFGVSVDDIIGVHPFSSKPQVAWYYLLSHDEELDGYWGNLGVKLPRSQKSKWYPISVSGHNSLYESRSENSWITLLTLNNKGLMINQRGVNMLNLLDEAADGPEDDWEVNHPEVEGTPLELYRGLSDVIADPQDLDRAEYSKEFIRSCERFAKEMSLTQDNLYSFLHDTSVYFIDGTKYSGMAEERSVASVYSDAESGAISDLFPIDFADREIFFSKPQIALIELPLIDLIDGQKSTERELASELGNLEAGNEPASKRG